MPILIFNICMDSVLVWAFFCIARIEMLMILSTSIRIFFFYQMYNVNTEYGLKLKQLRS